MSNQTNFYDMRTSFELQLNTPLQERLAVIGRFDGQTPSLVCATGTNRLIVHTSADPTPSTSPASAAPTPTLRTLHFSNPPTALAVGKVRDAAGQKDVDALYFGSATALQAYDVERNREYFYKTVEDGVRAVVCGVVHTSKASGGAPTPLAIVGGNCALHGFDAAAGTERLWTVTGDEVSAMALVPLTDRPDAPNALVAASEDFELRHFHGEDAVSTVMEADRIVQLVASGAPGRFAYLTAGGTVGVYTHAAREWRAKGKHRPVAAAFADVDGDGVAELVVGWRNGRVEVRGDDAARRGVLFRDTFAAPVSAVLSADYRRCGAALPVICTADGAVRGLELAAGGGGVAPAAREGRGAFALAARQRERRALAAECARLGEQLERHRAGRADATLPAAGTAVQHRLVPNRRSGVLDVALTVALGAGGDGGGVVLQGCVLRSAAAFPGRECAFYAADEPCEALVCPIDVPRGVSARVSASVMVGAANAASYQVHELLIDVPAFAMCREADPMAPAPAAPRGRVALQLPLAFPLHAVGEWLARTFALSAPPNTATDFVVDLVDMRAGCGVRVEGDVARRELTIHTADMETAGDVVESLGAAIATDAAASCHFPEELDMLQEVLHRVEEFNAVRLRLSSGMADVAVGAKPLLIRAEDARIMGDYAGMRRTYAALYDLNRELIVENLKRWNNYAELKAALKKVNEFIMQAARLRLGHMRTQLIADCREAVRKNDNHALINLIRTGQV